MDDPDLALDDEFGRHFGPGQFRHERQGPDTRVKVGEGRFVTRQVAQRDDKSTNCASAISYRGVGTGTVTQKTA